MVKKSLDGFQAVPEDPECIGNGNDDDSPKSRRSKAKVKPLSITSATREAARLAADDRNCCCSSNTLLWLTCGIMGYCLLRQSNHIGVLERRLQAEEERLLQHRYGDHDSGLGPGRAYQGLSEECFFDSTYKLRREVGKTLSQCRQLCDGDRHCRGFSFTWQAPKFSTCVTRSRACEGLVPGPCDWNRHWCSYKAIDSFQSRLCPDDMPPSDPWWSQYASLSKRHKHCLTRDAPTDCPDVPVTNRERIRILRGLLNATHGLMTSLDAAYAVIAGTTIGYYRCRDVLPWDGDNDIVVRREFNSKLGGVFKEPNRKNEMRNASLAFLGHSDSMLTEVEGCIGWRVVHIPTGLYVDIFSSDLKKDGNFSFMRYLYVYGNKRCKASDFRDDFFDKKRECDWRTCAVTNADWFWPAKPCKIGGVDVMCPRQAEKYVKETYKGVDNPDVPLRGLI